MLILTIKTDQPLAELGLFEGNQKLQYKQWQAHRELSEMLHKEIDNILRPSAKTWDDIQGIVVYKGPGSFTGLRIGISLANALSYSNECQIAATTGEDWIEVGIQMLLAKKGKQVALPEYGAPVHITKQTH